MPKTIAVVDEQGNTYEATYPKRARGLVKKGRARFVSENMICLVRPPKREEKSMSSTITLDMILEQVNKVVNNNAFFEEALQSLMNMTSSNVPMSPGAPPDVAGEARAKAVADICRARETTNQQLIRFYEKMYDDMMYMQGLRRENTPVVVKPILDERGELPPVPPVPDIPDMPDIPMMPPV